MKPLKWCHDDVIKCRITLNQSLLFKKIITFDLHKGFLQSIHHRKGHQELLKRLTDMTPIWPCLPVQTGSWKFQKFISQELLIISSKYVHQFKDRLSLSNFYINMTPVWSLLPVDKAHVRVDLHSLHIIEYVARFPHCSQCTMWLYPHVNHVLVTVSGLCPLCVVVV